MRMSACVVLLLPLSVMFTAASAQEAEGEKGIRLGRDQVQRLKVGVKIKAGGPCRGIVATVPVPMDWPEQQVRIIDESFSRAVKKIRYRTLDAGVKQMVATIPRLSSGEEAEAVLTVEIRRRAIVGPQETDIYTVPNRLNRELRIFLASSPFIESRHGKIRSLAREIVKDKPTDWKKVEAIYDHVRDNVEYRESELKGAVQTLKDGQGDCEAMTSLFIALCRAAKIPARMVWVTDHSYPEFYLVDDEQQGHWFPCQVAGSRAFGSMPETRAILQKGDNFKVPETNSRRRYVAIQLKAASVKGGKPKVTEITEFVSPTDAS